MLVFSSCSDLSIMKPTTQAASPTAVMAVLATVDPLLLATSTTLPPTPVAPTHPTSRPSSTPTLSPPIIESPYPTNEPSTTFTALRFARAADAEPQHTFPAGTEEVFAIWDYSDMQSGDRIRRIWFRDDQIWLTREEDWNWGKYRSTGTVLDNSVYDHEGSGLKSAKYHLQLYVNDQLQQEATFIVLAP